MMKYNKILQLGDPMIADMLEGEIIVEEKIDGSQFRIEIKNGEMIFGSHKIDYVETIPDKMFLPAIEIAKKVLKDCIYNVCIFGEFLNKPSQSTLTYERIPENKIMIFDIYDFDRNEWFDYEKKRNFASGFGFEVPPLLFKGDGKLLTKEKIEELLKTQSFLGKTTIEGIVVKNYSKTYNIIKFPYLKGHFMSGKYVREEFKELNKEVWKEIKKSPITVLIESLKTEARWRKAIQHLKEEGKLENNPRDIPNVIYAIIGDIEEEEKENIKEFLWENFWRDIRIGVTKGVAEFYKKELLSNLEGGESLEGS